MNRKSATVKSVAAHKLEPLCRPEFMAARIAAVLMPPSADMSSSFGSEPCISRRTSWRNISAISSVYTSTKCRRRPSIVCAEFDKSPLSIPAMPFGTARRAGQKQDRQHYKWSGDKCQKKSAKKTDPAINAAQSCKHTECDIDDSFEHGARSRRSKAQAP